MDANLKPNWVYYRDQIVFNSTFNQLLQKEFTARKLPPAGTLLVCARTARHEPGFVFRVPFGYNLILVVDEYDGAFGAVDVSGIWGLAGPGGASGVQGVADCATQEPGGQGGSGGAGSEGQPGNQMVVFTRHYTWTRLLANGGSGGAGGPGGAGGSGGSGFCVVNINGNKSREPVYSDGGNGGTGGPGANGGSGGNIQFTYILGDHPALLEASGGLAGPGGNGGTGGKSHATPGRPGATGRSGQQGPAGQAVGTPVNEQLYWSQLVNFMTTAQKNYAREWADYRLRVGEYYYRAYQPDNPATAHYLELALGEFRAVLCLGGSARAEQYVSQILNHQNILGFPYDLDLVPDFDRYEQNVSDYSTLVVDMVGWVKNILQDITSQGPWQNLMQQMADHANDQIGFLKTNLQIAQNDQQQAQDELNDTLQRLQTEQLKLFADQNNLLLGNYYDDNGKAALGSLFDVASVVLQFVGPYGQALAQIPGLIKGAWSAFDAGDLNGLSDNGKQLSKDYNLLVGGVTDIWNKTKPLISYLMASNDIAKAKIDAEVKQLIQECLELSTEEARRRLALNQATLKTQSVTQQVQASQNDHDRAVNLINGGKIEVAALADTARILFNQIQGYRDLLIADIFRAARSLDIYTMADPPLFANPENTGQPRPAPSRGITYDYGYLFPDAEADAYLALSRGEPDAAMTLTQQINNSWTRLPKIYDLRQQYDQYNQDPKLQSDQQIWHFKDAAMVQQFQKDQVVSFDLGLEEFAPDQYEIKVESVTVALVGAKSASGILHCRLEHSGRSTARRVDGSQVFFMAPPRVSPISCNVQSLASQAANGAIDQNFWGRSPAARWYLSIAPGEMTANSVDLSGLTEIQVSMNYRAVVK